MGAKWVSPLICDSFSCAKKLRTELHKKNDEVNPMMNISLRVHSANIDVATLGNPAVREVKMIKIRNLQILSLNFLAQVESTFKSSEHSKVC